MSSIRLRNVCKRFGKTETLNNIQLDIEDGEFTVFVGPSGCGKSTLLRLIAGLEEVSDGEILIGDELMNDVAPAHRGVAMVFQSYALYPHMTVAENMGYGLKVNGVAKDAIRHQVEMVSQHAATLAPAGPQAERAFRRPASARRHWPGDCPQPPGLYV